MFADEANNLDSGTWLMELPRPKEDIGEDEKRSKFMDNHDN